MVIGKMHHRYIPGVFCFLFLYKPPRAWWFIKRGLYNSQFWRIREIGVALLGSGDDFLVDGKSKRERNRGKDGGREGRK
jgi:hypothetical protein